jgi:hypothetical protein
MTQKFLETQVIFVSSVSGADSKESSNHVLSQKIQEDGRRHPFIAVGAKYLANLTSRAILM